MAQSHPAIELDVAVVGGGVAGLWLINRLRSAGYDAALLETRALGGEQSIASQGMIHGGLKYGLGGNLGAASRALAEMPGRWQACLNGRGEVDLRETRQSTEPFCLWSSGGLGAKMQAMLASRALHGRAQRLSGHHRPQVLNHPAFHGSVYGLSDLVLDMPSLATNLAANVEGTLFHPRDLSAQREADGQVNLMVHSGKGSLQVRAHQMIFTAGRGNAGLLSQLNLTEPAMQTRPLQQLMVKHPQLSPLYGHCLGTGTRPRLTVSSHRDEEGNWVWYLGGELAEAGAHKSSAALIDRGRVELETLFPWLDWRTAQWHTQTVERAEPRQAEGQRPDGASLHKVPECSNLLVGWPTKLTLAPHLADLVLDTLNNAGIQPSGTVKFQSLGELLPTPPVAEAPWQSAFKERL
jgi:hypothetical protein